MRSSEQQSVVYRLRGEVENEEKLFDLTRGDNVMGADPGSEVHVPEARVSRRHAVIRVGEHGVVVDDLDSTNGTFVNGIRVRTKQLEENDWIQVGAVILTFESVPISEHDLAIPLESEKEAAAPRAERLDLPSTEFGVGGETRTSWLKNLNQLAAVVFDAEASRIDAVLPVLSGLFPSNNIAFLSLGEDRQVTVLGCVGDINTMDRFQDPSVLVSFQDSTDRVDGRITSFCPQDDRNTVAAARWWADEWTHALIAKGDGIKKESAPLIEMALRLLLSIGEASDERLATSRVTPSEPLEFPPWHVVGRSPAMQTLYRQIGSLARSASPVLVTGETGVGKEHIVRILHASSERRGGPLQVVNCAAIPADLLEAELFGIERGVATGVDRRPGKLRLADGGILFLDEVGDMDGALQAKLLRALQDGEAHPVGAPSPVKVDVRVVAATNADLDSRVRAGDFRKDLYYRIAGCELRVPALRNRREDIPALVDRFLRRAAEDSGKAIRGLSVKALAELQKAAWPGNIRQLQREVERLVATCPAGQTIESSMISPMVIAEGAQELDDLPACDSDLNLKRNLERLERRIIIQALERAEGNHSEAARLLGVTRTGLTMKMKRLGVGRQGSGPAVFGIEPQRRTGIE